MLKSISKNFLLLAMVVVLLSYAYWHFGRAHKKDPHHGTRMASAKVIAEVISAGVPIPEGRPTIAVGCLESDFKGIASQALFSAMEAKDATITPLIPGARLLPGGLAGLQSKPSQRVVDLAQLSGAQYALVGRVTSWDAERENISIAVHFIDVSSELIVYKNSFTVTPESNPFSSGEGK